jgi:REP element-mobilizing transposase RayT
VTRSSLPGRRSIRLKGYDYAQEGAYFITVCTQRRAFLFGEIIDNKMQANEAGAMVIEEWHALPMRYPGVHLDAFVLMPNHLHAILFLAPEEAVGAGLVPAPLSQPTRSPAPDAGATTRVGPTLGDVIGALKSITTVRYARGVETCGWPAFSQRLWQRNYYEHVVRDHEGLQRIREYIAHNASRWDLDRENPDTKANASESEPWRA